MNIRNKPAIILLFVIILYSCNHPSGNQNSIVILKTTMGDIKIRLYDSTPIHRDNFLKLAKSGIYDNVLFHRVIKDFMIQSGDPSTRPGHSFSPSDTLNTYTIPAEFREFYYHKKGALAAAREGNEENPEMRSSGTQFYIVEGVKYTDSELDQAEQRINNNIKQSVFSKLLREVTDSLKAAGASSTEAEAQDIASIKMFDYFSHTNGYVIPADHREIYKTLGGTPRLDGTYTVFGEVIEGLDVVDRIAAEPTGASDKPVNDIRIIKVKIAGK